MGSIYENIKLRGAKDILNPKKWWVFLSSKARSVTGHDLDAEIAWAEQLIFRRSRCSACVEKGTCVNCACPTKEAMSEKSNKCSALQWGKYLSPTEWEEYKERYGIKIYVT